MTTPRETGDSVTQEVGGEGKQWALGSGLSPFPGNNGFRAFATVFLILALNLHNCSP